MPITKSDIRNMILGEILSVRYSEYAGDVHRRRSSRYTNSSTTSSLASSSSYDGFNSPPHSPSFDIRVKEGLNRRSEDEEDEEHLHRRIDSNGDEHRVGEEVGHREEKRRDRRDQRNQTQQQTSSSERDNEDGEDGKDDIQELTHNNYTPFGASKLFGGIHK